MPKRKKHGAFLLDLGDLHSFHKTGLTPRGFQLSTGNTLYLNKYQLYLHECWTHFLKRPDLPKSFDVLSLSGDLAEGQNYKEEGRDIVEPDPDWQARGVMQLLGPLAQRTRWMRKPNGWIEQEDGTGYEDLGERYIYAQSGSRYHAGRGASIEETACQMLRARRGRNGHYVQPWRDSLVLNGVLFDIAHNQSVVSRYRTMPLEREVGYWLERMGRLVLQGRAADIPRKLVLIRHHAHYGFRVIEEENIIAVAVPSWKLMDAFVRRGRMPNRQVPENLGSVGFWIRGTKEHPVVEVVPYLYEHPQNEWEVIDV